MTQVVSNGLIRSRGVAWLNTSACHAEDREFKSRRLRHLDFILLLTLYAIILVD